MNAKGPGLGAPISGSASGILAIVKNTFRINREQASTRTPRPSEARVMDTKRRFHPLDWVFQKRYRWCGTGAPAGPSFPRASRKVLWTGEGAGPTPAPNPPFHGKHFWQSLYVPIRRLAFPGNKKMAAAFKDHPERRRIFPRHISRYCILRYGIPRGSLSPPPPPPRYRPAPPPPRRHIPGPGAGSLSGAIPLRPHRHRRCPGRPDRPAGCPTLLHLLRRRLRRPQPSLPRPRSLRPG